jgi:hypothetical protein
MNKPITLGVGSSQRLQARSAVTAAHFEWHDHVPTIGQRIRVAARRALPVLAWAAVCGFALAAVIAVRLAIWLPMYMH